MKLVLCLLSAALLPAADTLDIYVLDVEGGKAVIARAPSGQTMLIDGGMPNARDLSRVAAAADALKIQQFDVHLITHYDVDHVGNVPAIYEKYPAKLLVDHGPLLPNPAMAGINRKAADAYVAFDRRIRALGAFLVAVTPLHIQQSHYFVMDAIVTFFVTVALYYAVRVAQGTMIITG